MVIGEQVGRYRIVAKMGEGGMGEVYRAHDTTLDRPVALKSLPPGMANDPERLRRFQAEARAASSLNHPHILVVHDFGDAEGSPFIVTELIEGETLRARLQRAPLPVIEAVEIARQAADALAAAHARGIVHRDIKPENVMLRWDGHIKVLDFGLAKLAQPAADGHTSLVTQPGVVMGTPRYMSPEQLRGLDVDARSDVWSLGVTLYEMITGQPPFAETTTADLIASILYSQVTARDLGAASVIVDRALSKVASNRYAEAGEMARELATVKKQLEASPASSLARPRRTSAVTRNFPLPIGAFIGRPDDLEGVQAALSRSPLVTLTGAGGVGKTRLALHVAGNLLDEAPDGVWLVDLAPLSDPGLVATTVADVFAIPQRMDRPVLDRLCEYLAPRTLVIVLDNCEHLIEACATLVQRLLSSCAGVRVLATSRETLNVPGEITWRLRSLHVPETSDPKAVAVAESVQLFLQRARLANPSFTLSADNASSIAQICRRLDGLPLAIELAAARVGAMSPLEIAERLDDRFRLLTGGSRMAVPRQRTLEATVTWSYELLSAPERTLFARLSVFAGGWTLDAAHRVCADEGLSRADIADRIAQLVERSMVLAEQTAAGRTRYRMLETFRQFGRDQLIARQTMSESRDRHLAWAVALAEAWKPVEMRTELAAELDNLRTALEWSYETERYESGLRIISAAPFGQLSERKRWLDLLLPFVDHATPDARSRVLYTAGALAFMIADWRWGVEILQASAAVNAAVGNAMRRSLSLTYLGACEWGLDRREAALDAVERALAEARAAQLPEALTRALLLRAWLETERDVDRAEELVIAAERASIEYDSVFDAGHIRELRAFVRCVKGDVGGGAKLLADAMTLFKNIQINCGSHVLETAAAWAAMTNRFELGAEFLGAARRIREETGDKPRPWENTVQQVWLPKIAAALAPALLDAAHSRGRQRPFAAALEHAERELRTAAGTPR